MLSLTSFRCPFRLIRRCLGSVLGPVFRNFYMSNLENKLVFNWNHFEMRFLNLRINFFFFLFIADFFPHLWSLFFFVLFLLSLRFGQISPLAFFRWFTATLDRNAESCNCIPSCCLSHHVFDQVNLWPAWVGFETAIFWQCSPGTAETQRLYPLRHGPWRAIKDGFFGLINPYLFFQSQVRAEFLYLSR